MSFKEINELRKARKLDEALQMANQALETEPENIWNKRAAAWVYYDYLKKNAQPESFEAFKENLIKIKDLQFPEDEKMVFDNCAWQIGSIVFALQKTEQVDYEKINDVFEIIKDFHFTKPSEAYSFIYKAFHKGFQNWPNYLTFADWWNFENFRPEDFLESEFNGRNIMSIAEHAYIAYSKKLLQKTNLGKQSNSETYIMHGVEWVNNSLIITDPENYRLEKIEDHNDEPFDKKQIISFLTKLDPIIEKHPHYIYLPYYKAKLLLALGEDENMLSAFIPFAKKKRNEFWVWSLMAEIFSKEKNIQIACYCKALSLSTKEDYLVKIRQTLAELLIEDQIYNEAKTEIIKVIDTRNKFGWKIPNQIIKWTKKEWYEHAIGLEDNQEFYARHLKKAEEILYQNIPEELIIVEFVNENKKVLHFVKNKEDFGFFKYAGHIDSPQIGDCLLVRFSKAGKDGFYKILSAKKADSNLTSEAIKSFEGTIKIIPPLNFGFIEDVFVEPKIIEENKIEDRKHLKGRAILSFNKKKNEWGWKAIEIK